MAKAHVDPLELRRFARDLNRFNTELQTLLAAQHARTLGLARSWRDQEHRRFAEEFEQTMKLLTRFLDSSSQHVGFLTRKATHVEEYLGQR